ncbi:FAD/NAD(P)-binding protein [Klebsiella pneumoniae]|uniref:FAD/NAD(P)-binding protein n=1 Tax=Klebsiella pneumoniae TaxID=573 RepID=UPI003976BD36
MKRIAIVGVGPTGIYTFYELVKRGEPLAITLFEKEAQAGVGMPYSDDNTAAQMLANIASIEIPPIDLTYPQWPLRGRREWQSPAAPTGSGSKNRPPAARRGVTSG